MSRDAELQKIFDESAKILAEGRPDAVIDILASAQKRGLTSSGLEANFGRAYTDKSDFANASIHYTKAVALDRFNGALRRDLKLAQTKIEGGVGRRLESPTEWAVDFASYVRPSEAMAFGSLILLGCLAARYLGKIRRLQLALGALVAILFLSLGALALQADSIAVLVDKQEVRRAPLETAEINLELKPGARVEILRKSGDFVEVSRAGARGWIKDRGLFRMPY